MDTHTKRARRRDAGFSMVELLVTIIIAGIAFAAMVPMFVQAQQKNSADLLRQQVANVAQGKIERIRQLDYSSIKADAAHPGTTPNLYNPAFSDSQFGPTESLSTGTGTRVINLSYSVEDYPTGATGITSQYKVVHITATWDAPPRPVKPVTISTIVYRQYSGPPITDFSTEPVMDDTGLLGDQNLSEVLLSAHVDPSGGVAAVSVEFAVAQYGGATLASATVDYDHDERARPGERPVVRRRDDDLLLALGPHQRGYERRVRLPGDCACEPMDSPATRRISIRASSASIRRRPRRPSPPQPATAS